MEVAEVTEILLPKTTTCGDSDSFQETDFGLKNDNSSSCLKSWVFLDYSSPWRTGFSWSMFFLLNIGVPLVSHVAYSSCSDCDRRPYDAIVQFSLSLFAGLSFVSLSCFARRYIGVPRFLFLGQSDKFRQGYTHQQLHRSMKLLWAFVLPCFFADSVYKIWWFSSGSGSGSGSGGNQIPNYHLYHNIIYYSSKVIVCILLMCSWLYRVSICFLVCLLFRLTCYLQILRLEAFAAQVFENESDDVASILIHHLRIRRNLRVISHRFRFFILSTLILVTISQFVSLLVTTVPSSTVNNNLSTAGELALCSITLVTGLFICLRSAAKITHKAQAVTSLAAKWHACATIDQTGYPVAAINWDSDINEEGDGDENDVLDNTNLVPFYGNTISFQKRQALVTYLEHNKAGITVYGFMLDRTWLHTIFAIQFSLTLWILKKTIVIS